MAFPMRHEHNEQGYQKSRAVQALLSSTNSAHNRLTKKSIGTSVL